MNKRFALVITAGIIALSLSACGSSTTSSTSSAAVSVQASSSTQSASPTSDDLKSEYKEAVEYISSDECEYFRTRSSELLDVDYAKLITEGNSEAIDELVTEYKGLVDGLPKAYDKPESTKKLYGYLQVLGGYELSALEKYRDAASAVRENRIEDATALMDSGTADIKSIGEASQNFVTEYKTVGDAYMSMLM